MNEIPNPFLGVPPQIFTIHSHYAGQVHEAMLTSPITAKVAIFCPWPPVANAEEMSIDQRAYIMETSQSVTRYLINEGILDSSQGGVGVVIFTKHPGQGQPI
jgi:hypothetical protein